MNLSFIHCRHPVVALHQRQVHNGTREHNTRFFAKHTGLPAPVGRRRGSDSRLAAVFDS